MMLARAVSACAERNRCHDAWYLQCGLSHSHKDLLHSRAALFGGSTALLLTGGGGPYLPDLESYGP
eukprot:365025-Chlamydomonas_euryale.AAC.23